VSIIAKDKIIGLIIMLLGIIIAILYTLGSIVDLWAEAIGVSYGFKMPIISDWTIKTWHFDIFSWRLFVVLPLWLLVVLICIIAIWIGYSMLTSFGIPSPGISPMKAERLHLFHSKIRILIVF
jgi:hypothetical protein